MIAKCAYPGQRGRCALTVQGDKEKETNLIYEINTRVWLKALSVKYSKNIMLANIPEEEIKQFKKLGINAVWLMGVWRSSQE